MDNNYNQTENINNNFNGNILWKDKKRPIFGLPISFTTYKLYDEKIVIDKGLLLRSEEEVRLYRIVDFSVRQTLLQRIFRVGTILCYSSDNSSANFSIIDVKNPYNVKDLLSDIVEKERQRNHVVTGEMIQ